MQRKNLNNTITLGKFIYDIDQRLIYNTTICSMLQLIYHTVKDRDDVYELLAEWKGDDENKTVLKPSFGNDLFRMYF